MKNIIVYNHIKASQIIYTHIKSFKNHIESDKEPQKTYTSINIIEQGLSRAWGRSSRGGPGPGPSAVGPGPRSRPGQARCTNFYFFRPCLRVTTYKKIIAAFFLVVYTSSETLKETL